MKARPLLQRMHGPRVRSGSENARCFHRLAISTRTIRWVGHGWRVGALALAAAVQDVLCLAVVEMIDRIDPAPSHRYVIAHAPPMPSTFYGVVRFEFQAGKLVLAIVEEKLKPTT